MATYNANSTVATSTSHLDLESKLFAAPVPSPTQSYSPVPHRDIIEKVQEECDKRGFIIESKQYWTGRYEQQMTGKFNIKVAGDEELGTTIMFRSSYDKTLSLGFAAGGNVWICTNGQVAGDITLVRRHTGSIVNEIHDKIETSLDQLEAQYKKLSTQNGLMKNIIMTKQDMAKLAGQMFIEQELITSTQLNIIKKEIYNSEHFKNETLWDMYNHTTEAYKKSTAYSFIDNHKNLHQFVEAEFELV